MSLTLILTACTSSLTGTNSPTGATPPNTESTASSGSGFTVSFNDVKQILDQRCLQCHSNQRGVAYSRVSFDTAQEIQSHASAINRDAVQSRFMPQGNSTGMTDAERQTLGQWIAAGASVQ